MPEYLAPGVYVEEFDRGPKPIEGVPTNTAALLGETERGPVAPTLVTSTAEYARRFGGACGDSAYMPDAVKGYFGNGGRHCYVARIVGARALPASTTIEGITLEAVGPGAWGNRVFVRVEPAASEGPEGAPVGLRLRVYYWEPLAGGAIPSPSFDAHGNVTNSPQPKWVEDFDDLCFDEASSDSCRERVDSSSVLVTITNVAQGIAVPGAATGSLLQGGAQGADPVRSDYEGTTNMATPSGLAALEREDYRDVALVHAPNTGPDVAAALVGHCENHRFRFAVLDAPADQTDVQALDPRAVLDTKYAAFYYPWIWIDDDEGQRRKVPPGGFVCGIYARTDIERGIWKSPANELVRAAVDVEFEIGLGEQELLNPRGVNCIRKIPGRGIRVWGARTLSSDPLWKYISVRRLFNFLEASIYRSTQWVVFEPNDANLWARVKQTVTQFLRTQWRQGALFGATEEEAFVVSVGRDTMTEDDIDNGRLIVEIGIAPVRPAEFVIFRIFQRTREAD